MLVLKRKKDESLTFLDAESGDMIAVVKVVNFQGKSVGLGTTADKRVRIVRTELLSDTITPVSDPVPEVGASSNVVHE